MARRETIKPENEEHWLELRKQDITSTEVSALFGISPYLTEFELWHRKLNAQASPFEENNRMKWGRRLQDAIANGVAEDEGFKVRPMTEYIRDPDLRIGSSFDFAIGDDGILEIKNVDSYIFSQQWEYDDGDNLEAPPHIEIQVQHQLLLSGRDFAYICAFKGGNDPVLIKREPDSDVMAAIEKRAKAFWKSIGEGREPAPNFERDAKFLSSLYRYAEPNKVIQSTPRIQLLANEYKSIADSEKEIKARKDAVKAQLLMEVGDAEKVLGDMFSISAGIIGPTVVPEHTREGYRNFRINWRKKK